jgi:hypothetical protein
VVASDGGEPRRPEFEDFPAGDEEVNGGLCSIEGLLLRFLARGGSERRGASIDGRGAARG